MANKEARAQPKGLSSVCAVHVRGAGSVPVYGPWERTFETKPNAASDITGWRILPKKRKETEPAVTV